MGWQAAQPSKRRTLLSERNSAIDCARDGCKQTAQEFAQLLFEHEMAACAGGMQAWHDATFSATISTVQLGPILLEKSFPKYSKSRKQ